MEKFAKTKAISFVILAIASTIFTIHFIFFNYTIFLVIPLIKAVYLLLNLFIIGFIISKFIKVRFSVLESTAIGLIFTTFYFYVISFLKILNPITLALYYFIGAISFYFFFKNEQLRNEAIFTLKILFKRNPLEFLVFIIPFLYASLPSTFYDSLVYHLGIPNLYLQNGGFIRTPYFLYANTSIYYEISLIPAVYTGDFVPRLLHFLISSIFILCFVDFMTEYFNLKKKNYLILLILSLPVSLFLISTVKNDIIAAIFIFLGIKNFIKKRYGLSGIFFGFSIGVKYFSALPVLFFFLFEIFPWKKEKIKGLVLMGLLILIIITPLLIKNYKFTSNPIYPFFNKVFKSKSWSAERNFYLKRDVGKILSKPKDIFKSFYYISFKNYGSGGRIGPVFLIFLPFITIFMTKKLKLIFYSLLVFFIGCFFTGSLRFLFILILLLTPFVVEVLENMESKLMKIIFFLIVGMNFLLSFSILERVYSSHSLYSWKLSVYKYKVKYFPAYSIYSFINQMTPKKSKILVVGEARSFYLKRPYSVSSAIDYSILKPYLDESKDSKEFFKKIKRDGYDFIFISLGEFQRLQKQYNRLNKEEYKKFLSFFSVMKPVFHRGMFFIYKL